MDDIVERLREHIAVVIDNKGHVFDDEHLCDIAADRIEALEARIAKADALAEVAKRAVKLSQQDDTFKLYAMEPIWQALADYRDGTDTLVAAVLDKVVQDRDEALNQLDSERYSVEVLKRRVQKVREKALREAARECAYACGCQDAVLALIEKDAPPKTKKSKLVGTGVQVGLLKESPSS